VEGIINVELSTDHAIEFFGVVVMTEASSADFEMSINLPLGVLANQLMRIEKTV
jgi:hypothetical protein